MVKVTLGTSLQRLYGTVTTLPEGEIEFEYEDGTKIRVRPLKDEDGVEINVLGGGGWRDSLVVRPVSSNQINIVPVDHFKPIKQEKP